MAALTVNTNQSTAYLRFLEDLTVVNAAAPTTISRAVRVPDSAKSVSFYLFVDAQGGSTPTLDVSLWVPDFGSALLYGGGPDDANVSKLGDFAGITQVTGAGPYLQTIDIGPGVTGIADDGTGAATADARMAINTYLPPWIQYIISYDGTTADEDYTVRLVAKFRRF